MCVCETVPTLVSVQPSNGTAAGGTILTLVGTDWGANDLVAVSFGSQPAAGYTWVSPTLIRAVTPPYAAGGPLTVALHVASQLFGNATLADAFTFLPPPSVQSVQPAHGAAGGNTTVTIAGTRLGANDIVSVTLCDVSATEVTWLSATRIVVRSGASPSAEGCAAGAVSVTSASMGVAVAARNWTYYPGTLHPCLPGRHVEMLTKPGVLLTQCQSSRR